MIAIHKKYNREKGSIAIAREREIDKIEIDTHLLSEVKKKIKRGRFRQRASHEKVTQNYELLYCTQNSTTYRDTAYLKIS